MSSLQALCPSCRKRLAVTGNSIQCQCGCLLEVRGSRVCRVTRATPLATRPNVRREEPAPPPARSIGLALAVLGGGALLLGLAVWLLLVCLREPDEPHVPAVEPLAALPSPQAAPAPVASAP
jgi:hypothetical protein